MAGERWGKADVNWSMSDELMDISDYGLFMIVGVGMDMYG